MNVIVIDDLIHVVKGIVAGVNWNKLNIDQVFEAFNIIEAKKLFEEHDIEVLVSDIEMPMGNGLELLEWVREFYPKTECIFLTSHEEFEYAKAAIKLGSFDYLIQPIKYEELEKVIEKAVLKIKSDEKLKTLSTYGVFWQENQKNILEKFWFDLLSGLYNNNITKIKKVADAYNINGCDSKRYQLVLISILRREVLLSNWDDELLKYALTNILGEILEKDIDLLQIVKIDSGHLVWVLSENENIDELRLNQLLNIFIHASFRDIKCSLSCYVSEYHLITELPNTTKRLITLANDNVACYKKVFHENSFHRKENPNLEIPNLLRWETCLNQGQNDLVYEEVDMYLNQLLHEERLDSGVLFEFHQKFIKMFYRVVELKQFDTHQLLRVQEASGLYIKSLNSIYDMLEFIKFILSFKFDEEHVSVYYETSIDQIKEYIRENLEKDLTRNELAERVFLNQEYLSKLFKKQTGVSLSTYIINERINVAKGLLVKTDMSVSLIASKIGYSNFSHFSQIFKKSTGLTPVEYRQSKR